MSLQDFLGHTPDIIIIDFLAENSDEVYNQTEISECTGLSRDTIQEALPALILNKIVNIVDDNSGIKRFRLNDNDIVNHLIKSVLSHSFAMAEEERSEEEIYDELYESIRSEFEEPINVYKEKLEIPGIERFTLKDAIEKVKNNAMTNVILISHMINLTIEQKLYLAYFYGTREDKPTILDFQEE